VGIYEDLGGSAAISVTVDAFYKYVLADPVLASYFKDADMTRLKCHQQAFLGVAMGGPEVYSGREMAEAHQNLRITDEAFWSVIDHLVATLAGLDAPEEVVAAIGPALSPLYDDIVTGESSS
jgi:hemoglobin